MFWILQVLQIIEVIRRGSPLWGSRRGPVTENSTNIFRSLNALLFFQYIYHTTYIVYLEDRTEPIYIYIYDTWLYMHVFIYLMEIAWQFEWQLLDMWMEIAGHLNTARKSLPNVGIRTFPHWSTSRSYFLGLIHQHPHVWSFRPPISPIEKVTQSQCRPTCKTCITLGEGSCNTSMVKAGGSRFHSERANRNWKARNITKSVVYTHQLIWMIRISIFTLIGNFVKVPDFWIFAIPKTFTDNPSKIIPNPSCDRTNMVMLNPFIHHWTIGPIWTLKLSVLSSGPNGMRCSTRRVALGPM